MKRGFLSREYEKGKTLGEGTDRGTDKRGTSTRADNQPGQLSNRARHLAFAGVDPNTWPSQQSGSEVSGSSSKEVALLSPEQLSNLQQLLKHSSHAEKARIRKNLPQAHIEQLDKHIEDTILQSSPLITRYMLQKMKYSKNNAVAFGQFGRDLDNKVLEDRGIRAMETSRQMIQKGYSQREIAEALSKIQVDPEQQAIANILKQPDGQGRQ